jgi:mono/diheme cytochrome c family protein
MPSNRRNGLLIAALLVPPALRVSLTAQTSAASQPTGTANGPTGDIKRGKELFLAYKCYACHGYSGQNGPGARLVPMRMNLVGFMAYVRNPRQMPPYSAQAVPNQDLIDIFSYVQTLPRSPAAADIPLLTRILSEK